MSSRVIHCSSFENAKYKEEEKKICLSQKGDVAKFMVITMSNRESELVRLTFVFSCLTGIAIADMENLEHRHIQMAADGREHTRKERQKTKVEFVAPLHPIAEAIIRHYLEEQEENEERQVVGEKGKRHIFPRECSRSVIDGRLNTIGKTCGIKQRLLYHVTRHIFGAISLNAGIPTESIARMMGHASISDTQICTQVADGKISEDIDRLIAKQSAKDREAMEREAREPLEVSTCKMEETT